VNSGFGAVPRARAEAAPKPALVVRNARIVTFDDANRVLDGGAVEILADGTIGAIRADATHRPASDFLDAGGRLLMPALINCHTHLYSTLARGISLPGGAPKNFPEILKKLWWRLDCALNEEDVYYSAMVGLIDSAKNGVGMAVDHHSSPNACSGSLDRIAQAFHDVGLRGVACYETTDRNGAAKAEEGIRENIRFLELVERGYSDRLVRGSFGLHASFTLGDRTLRQASDAARSLKSGFHVHVAEDTCDVAHARKHHRKSPVARLHDLGVLDDKSIAAHCVHVSPADIRQLAKRKINVVHNPQSNCNNAVGAARLLEMTKAGVTVGLGSDGYSPRMWEEFKAAFHVQKLTAGDPRVAYHEAYAAALLNNRKIARKAWGLDIGAIVPGARADLLLVDYWPPTPLTPDNLFGHFLFGIANAPVDTLIVNGRFVVRDKKIQTVDERAVMERASTQARALWRRF
jgi:putative selenium metabolism protein SsnA